MKINFQSGGFILAWPNFRPGLVISSIMMIQEGNWATVKNGEFEEINWAAIGPRSRDHLQTDSLQSDRCMYGVCTCHEHFRGNFRHGEGRRYILQRS